MTETRDSVLPPGSNPVLHSDAHLTGCKDESTAPTQTPSFPLLASQILTPSAGAFPERLDYNRVDAPASELQLAANLLWMGAEHAFESGDDGNGNLCNSLLSGFD